MEDSVNSHQPVTIDGVLVRHVGMVVADGDRVVIPREHAVSVARADRGVPEAKPGYVICPD